MGEGINASVCAAGRQENPSSILLSHSPLTESREQPRPPVLPELCPDPGRQGWRCRGEWVGRGFPGAPPLSCGSPIVALTKAALFLPTAIPCQHPSAFQLQISCPLAACQEAGRGWQEDEGSRLEEGGVSQGQVQGGGVPRNVWVLLPEVFPPALGPQHQRGQDLAQSPTRAKS